MKPSKYEFVIALTLFAMLFSTAQASTISGLPDVKKTPGALNPLVTPATIGTTICVIGYTKTIRPPSNYTSSLKRQQLNSGYNYQGDLAMSDYEEDHLVPLTIGGSPKSVLNLWPEPRNISRGASAKDRLENKMHLMICSGMISLKSAQQIFMINWVAGYEKYIGKLA
jgi:hypothetical protein